MPKVNVVPVSSIPRDVAEDIQEIVAITARNSIAFEVRDSMFKYHDFSIWQDEWILERL